MRVAALAALVLAGIVAGSTLALGGGPRNAYVVHGLVSDEHRRAANVDHSLVNVWGIAATPTGPWWTSNEASSTSTLYSSSGRKQLLTVKVDGGPTGIAAYAGKGLPGAFVDAQVPAWYAPFGIHAVDGHVFVTYVGRAPVDGNDDPTGGYVDEFDRFGHLVARVAQRGPLNAPWGVALAPRSFGRFGGDLLVGNFGDGHINAFRRTAQGWSFDGALHDPHGKPITISGLWGIAFGNGAMAGDARTLFFASGPHVWRGETELGVHGLLGSISPA